MDNNIIWKDIIINNIITNYEVNNIGQVRNKINGKILKSYVENNSYQKIIIYINNKQIPRFIHRLVAIAFIPNLENKKEINHINGIKTDNRVENLEWCTRSENIKHAYDNGLEKPRYGSNCNFNKYSEDKIHIICKLLEKKVPMRLITLLLDVKFQIIKSIKYKQNWKQISELYNIPKKYDYIIIKYNKLKKILIELNIFNNIDLLELLDSKYIINKNKLINDLINQGYEIFIHKYEIKEFNL